MPKKSEPPFESVYFVNHSHIDHTWWNSPEACRERNEEIITEVLSIAAAEPAFKFSYETTAGLIQYLEKYPDRTDEVRNLLKQRRLDVGGLFVSANDDVCTGEGIVRNFVLGSRWLQKHLGYVPQTAKEFDTPGHPVQLPQLIRDAGMKALIITRGPKGGFYWAGPDGTEVFTFCVPYNWSFWRRLGVSVEETEKNLPRELLKAAASYPGPDLIVPDGDDMTLPNPGLVDICKTWNKSHDRPKLHLATFEEIVEVVGRRRFPRRSGDIPNLWIVIHTLQAETTRRLRTLQNLLSSVESLWALTCVLKGDYKQYPSADIDQQWRRILLVADHNWGGKDETRHGAAGDEHKHALVLKSLRECRAMTENGFFSLSKLLLTKEPSLGMPLLVFNPCAWERTDAVSVDVDCGVTGLHAIEVVDAEGSPVPSGFEVRERHQDGSIHKAVAGFLGSNIPSFGYSTFYVKPVLQPVEAKPAETEDSRTIENEYYRVTFAADGSRLESVYDKELDRELAVQAKASLGPLDFEFGTFELFGIGMKLTVPDESFFENPEHEGTGESVEPTGEVVRAADFPARMSVSSSGNLWRSLSAEAEFAGSKRRQTVVLYKGLKKLDLHVELEWSGKPDMAVYLQMPTALMNEKRCIDAPFSVHSDGNELTDFWADESMPVAFRIRGVQDWLCFEGEDHGLALATQWPVLDLTSVPSFPLLWTNDNSGFFFGERYRQKGTHRFSLSLTSYKGSWLENRVHLWGKQWARPLLTFFGDAAPEVERRSYLTVNPQNVVVSALKKAQDEDALVIRLYETAGKKTDAELTPSFAFQEARESNITEITSKKLSAQKGSIRLRFRPHEIKTIKLVL